MIIGIKFIIPTRDDYYRFHKKAEELGFNWVCTALKLDGGLRSFCSAKYISIDNDKNIYYGTDNNYGYSNYYSNNNREITFEEFLNIRHIKSSILEKKTSKPIKKRRLKYPIIDIVDSNNITYIYSLQEPLVALSPDNNWVKIDSLLLDLESHKRIQELYI